MLCLEKNLDVYDLHEKLGISKERLFDLDKGNLTDKLRILDIAKISTFFNVTLSDIFRVW
jgi:DNA-binding Xre family transcriptional regulator